MPCSGCSALHGVNPGEKRKTVDLSSAFLFENHQRFLILVLTQIRKSCRDVLEAITIIIESFGRLLHNTKLDVQRQQGDAIHVNKWVINNFSVTTI